MQPAHTSAPSEVAHAPFTTYDGHILALFDWPVPAPHATRAVVLVCHGLGEHAWRYDPLAQALAAQGVAVRAYDQRGHGESAGPRGCLPQADALLLDLQAVVEDTHDSLCATHGLPLVVLGHSLGGLVAAQWLVRDPLGPAQRLVAGLVLSSPALRVRVPAWQRVLLPVLARWWPHLTIGHGLDAVELSQLAPVVMAYRADPLVHDRLSWRLAHALVTGGEEVLRLAHRWPTPTLLMYASADAIVDPAGCEELTRQAPSQRLQVQAFSHSRHEVFNDVERGAAIARLLAWLTELASASHVPGVPAPAQRPPPR